MICSVLWVAECHFQALHLNFSLYEATFRIQGISAKLGGKDSFPVWHRPAAQEQIIQCSTA